MNARISVVFGAEPGPGDAVLVEAGCDAPVAGYVLRFGLRVAGHALGCACCAPRGPVAEVLSRMFRERAVGVAPFFKRVVVVASVAGVQAVREALEGDVVTKARFKEEVLF